MGLQPQCVWTAACVAWTVRARSSLLSVFIIIINYYHYAIIHYIDINTTLLNLSCEWLFANPSPYCPVRLGNHNFDRPLYWLYMGKSSHVSMICYTQHRMNNSQDFATIDNHLLPRQWRLPQTEEWLCLGLTGVPNSGQPLCKKLSAEPCLLLQDLLHAIGSDMWTTPGST